jgi:uncharacterized damage-inducible protein DinB
MTTMTDIAEILAGLKASPTILREFVSTIDEDRLNLRRGEGFWTIAEHVSHLAQVQQMLLERFQRFMTEEHPVFVPFIPGQEEAGAAAPATLETTEALRRFAELRATQLAILEKADGAIWQRTAEHPEYDRYSLYILARHVLMHDHWHMYRMEELWLTRDAYITRLE